MRLRLNAWTIESFAIIYLRGDWALTCSAANYRDPPMTPRVNKLFNIKFTIVRLSQSIFYFSGFRFASAQFFSFFFFFVFSTEIWNRALHLLCAHRCVRLMVFAAKASVYFSYFRFIGITSYRPSCISANRKNRKNIKAATFEIHTVKFYFTRKYDNDMLRLWVRSRQRYWDDGGGGGGDAVIPLNTHYILKLMHHSYAHSDWLENWAKFVFFPSFVAISFAWVSVCVCVRRLYTSCLHALFWQCQSWRWLNRRSPLQQIIDQTEKCCVCGGVAIAVVAAATLLSRSLWPLPQNTNDHHQMERIRSCTRFFISFPHFQIWKSKLAMRWRMSCDSV